MITELRIGNFQGFGEGQVIPLAPLTLVFGPNSAGKSSIFRSLLLLKQSTTGGIRQDGKVSFVDSETDLGSFSNVVHKHDVEREISLGLSIAEGESINDIDFQIREGDVVSSLRVGRRKQSTQRGRRAGESFALTFREDASDAQAWQNLAEDDLEGIAYLIQCVKESTGRFGFIRRKREAPSDAENQLEFRESDFLETIESFAARRQGIFASFQRPDFLSSFVRDGAKDPNMDEFKLFEFWNSLDEVVSGPARRLNQTLRKLTYVAGLRAIPERVTMLNSSSIRIARDGSNLGEILNNNPKIAAAVSKWLSDITEGAYEINLQAIKDPSINFLGQLGSVTLRDKRLNTTTTFQDVGVGLSQVVPIITALLQASNSHRTTKSNAPTEGITNTVLIEQPELHLHPGMQAQLADLLIQVSAATQKSGPQVIVETHSENIVLRIQRRIREGLLEADRICILYVSKDEASGESRVQRLGLDGNADFVETWPLSFGSLRLDEVLPKS